jgi:hypothetical protein
LRNACECWSFVVRSLLHLISRTRRAAKQPRRAWPGKALAYEVGEQKMLALRARAAEALRRFDLRAFRDLVPGAGPMPLAVLE